jgi:hypothetical protein
MSAINPTARQLCFIASGLVLAYADERTHRDRMLAACAATHNGESKRIFINSANASEGRMGEIRELVATLPELGQRIFAEDLTAHDALQASA